MAAELRKRVFPLEGGDHWGMMLDMSLKKLVVMDCYQDWCGSCDIALPTLAQAFLDYDDVHDRLVLCTANVSKMGKAIQASLDIVGGVDIASNGCIPVFTFYKNRQCVGCVVGLDMPSILQIIATNIPDKDKTDANE